MERINPKQGRRNIQHGHKLNGSRLIRTLFSFLGLQNAESNFKEVRSRVYNKAIRVIINQTLETEN